MELTQEDKLRIEQFADSKDRRLTSYHKGLMDGAEYEHKYQREEALEREKFLLRQVERVTKQAEEIKQLKTENGIYFQERNEAWKQNAQLEAERSELVKENERLRESVKLYQGLSNGAQIEIQAGSKIIKEKQKQIEELKECLGLLQHSFRSLSIKDEKRIKEALNSLKTK